MLLTARADAAAAALRRLAPAVADIDTAVVGALIDASYAPADTAADLPLYAANRALASPTDLVEMLWQLCTILREHRGDAHVAALRAAGARRSRGPPAARGRPGRARGVAPRQPRVVGHGVGDGTRRAA